MLICVPDVLDKAEVADFRRIMDGCAWEDGRSTAGAQSALVKSNEQLPPDGEVARQLGNRVLSALTTNPRFISAAGHLVLYPATSLHMVTPVTRGMRVASFLWLQSMIRDAHARSLIFDLDTAIQALVERLGRDDPETVKLTGIYHNLIRYWAEV